MNESVLPRPYFRTPQISPDGRQIAFVYAGDIWVVDANGGAAERLTVHTAGHIAPRWSPDGSHLAFASWRAGSLDVYVLPLQGGDPRRLTCHDSSSSAEAWSHDGSHVFFSSYRELQGSAIYRVAAAGGTPIAWIAQPYEDLDSLAVSPDGSLLAFNLSRDRWWRRGPNPYGGAEVWVASNAPGAGDFRKLSDYDGLNRWPLWAPGGDAVYVVSDRDGVENIWVLPLEGGPVRRVSAFGEGRLLWPSISRDGRTIVFEREFGLWRLDTASGQAEPVAVRVSPDTKVSPPRVYTTSRDLSELALAPDGKKLAFVVRGEVFADFADKETDKERRQGQAFRVTSTPARERHVVWSPDSRQLLYDSDRHGDEEIYRYDFTTRAETRLTEGPRPKIRPIPSPDGAWIAYVCGDDEIRLIERASGRDQPFVRADLTNGTGVTWSPDSRWLAFVAQDERYFSNLYVQQVGDERAHQLTFLSNLSAYHPIWAASGQFIVFTTAQYRDEAQIARVDLRPQPTFFREEEFERLFEDRRQGTGDRRQGTGDRGQEIGDKETEPATPAGVSPGDVDAEHDPSSKIRNPQSTVEIVFDGIERRLRFLTSWQMDAFALCLSPDSRDLIFRATVAGKTNLWTLPLDEPRADQSPRQLTNSSSAKWAAQFAPDGKSYFFLEDGEVRARKFPGGETIPFSVSAEVTFDFHQEKRQVFDEAWRLLRDRFYDPTFRGLDWAEARAQFAPLAAGAQTPGDLRAVLNLMVGELRASHLGAYPAGSGGSQDGYVGLIFDPVEQARSGRLRIAAVVSESPAARAGIQAGEELLAADGLSLAPGASFDSRLNRSVGRRVRLRVAPWADQPGQESPGESREGRGAEREVAVRPISADQYDELRYRAWVYDNEAYVHRVSDGRLGYVHIRRMDYACYQQFLADLDAETYSKEGVVVDVRFNGGGHTATFILDVLARQSVLLSTFRDRPAADAGHFSGNRVLNKPTVLVINEGSASNTEMFAEGYRRLGLGKVVGRTTAGAVIWTYRHALLDGTMFKIPRLRIATPEGEDLEGTGRAVDVDVPLPLGATARGVDPQLDAAVAVLLRQIDERDG